MLRKLLILGVCAGISASLPILYQNNREAVHGLIVGSADVPSEEDGPAGVSVSVAVPVSSTPGGRRVVIRGDARGHFVAEFRLNGRRVPAMVDTGATLVAMNRSTARSLGLQLTAADFKYSIDTANGKARAAAATIPSIDIGRIRVENVEGVVLEDGALGQILIGMSFLKRLDSYQVQDGALLLAQ